MTHHPVWPESGLVKLAGLSEAGTIARVERLADLLAGRFGRPIEVCRRAAKQLHNGYQISPDSITRPLGNLTLDLIDTALSEARNDCR